MTNSHADHDQQQTTADEASSEPDLAADGDNPAAVASEENRSEEASGEATENASEEASEDAAPQTEADALRTELEEALAEQEETNDRLLRTAAELQNVRRRATQAKAAALRPMLEVLDDLQRALAAAEDAEEEEEDGGSGDTLYDGVQMVEDKFERALAGLGVEPIAAEGHPFDENKHEAMMQQPAPEGTDPGTVLAEIRRGYRMETDADDEDEGERVLRHSRVVVATEPEPPAEEESSNAGESADE